MVVMRPSGGGASWAGLSGSTGSRACLEGGAGLQGIPGHPALPARACGEPSPESLLCVVLLSWPWPRPLTVACCVLGSDPSAAASAHTGPASAQPPGPSCGGWFALPRGREWGTHSPVSPVLNGAWDRASGTLCCLCPFLPLVLTSFFNHQPLPFQAGHGEQVADSLRGRLGPLGSPICCPQFSPVLTLRDSVPVPPCETLARYHGAHSQFHSGWNRV